MNIALLTLLVLSHPIAPQSVVEINTDITKQATWKKGNTYVVTADVVVDDSVKLIVQPGTHIQFFNHGHLDIKGTLTAIGTEREPILFSHFGNGTAPASAAEIGVMGDADFKYCVFETIAPEYFGGREHNGYFTLSSQTCFGRTLLSSRTHAHRLKVTSCQFRGIGVTIMSDIETNSGGHHPKITISDCNFSTDYVRYDSGAPSTVSPTDKDSDWDFNVEASFWNGTEIENELPGELLRTRKLEKPVDNAPWDTAFQLADRAFRDESENWLADSNALSSISIDLLNAYRDRLETILTSCPHYDLARVELALVLSRLGDAAAKHETERALEAFKYSPRIQSILKD